MGFERNNNFAEVENAAYNNYDDSDEYDSDSYDSENYEDFGTNANAMTKPHKKMSASFDLKFSNPTAQSITFELFNVLNSFLKKIRTDYAAATYTYIPYLSLQGLAAAGLGVVAFDDQGVLQVTSTNNALPNASLSCQQFPYSGLLESSGSEPFWIKRIRQNSMTNAQIDNQIIHFRSSFLGSQAQNQITPRQFFRPTQFQQFTVDIPVNFKIDSTKGITYVLNAGEVVTWNITIEKGGEAKKPRPAGVTHKRGMGK